MKLLHTYVRTYMEFPRLRTYDAQNYVGLMSANCSGMQSEYVRTYSCDAQHRRSAFLPHETLSDEVMYPCHNFSRQILLYVPVSHYNTACVPPSAVSDNLYYSTSPPHIGMSCTSHIPYTPCSTSSPSVSVYSSSSFPIPPIVSSYSFPNNMPYSYTDTIYILHICHTLHIPCTPVEACHALRE